MQNSCQTCFLTLVSTCLFFQYWKIFEDQDLINTRYQISPHKQEIVLEIQINAHVCLLDTPEYLSKYRYKPTVYQSLRQSQDIKNIRKGLKKRSHKKNWQFNNKNFSSQIPTYPARRLEPVNYTVCTKIVQDLWNKGPLKVLNDTKLILDDQEYHKFIINLGSSRSIRDSLFQKPFTLVRYLLFWGTRYNKPALIVVSDWR